MIGAGVFTTSGYSFAGLENRSLVMWAWFIAGMIAICGAISYGQLARRITESGGEYTFLSRAVHPSIGFIAGWVSLLAGFTGAIAFAALTFEQYAFPADLRPTWYPRGGLAIAVLLVFGLLHGLKMRSGLATQNLVVFIKLGLLVAFLIYAFTLLPAGQWPGITIESSESSFSFAAFANALVWISLSYSGFNAAVYVAAEVRSPRKNVPLALGIGTVLVMAIYLALNFVFLFAADPTLIFGKEDIAAITANALGGTNLEIMVRVIIALAMASSVSSMVVAGPRVYAKMAEDGVFPKFLAANSRDGNMAVPQSSIQLQIILATVVILATQLKDLLDYLGFTLSISAALTVACLFWVGRSKSDKYPFVVWTIALIYVSATLVVAVASLQSGNQLSLERVGLSFSIPIKLIVFVGTCLTGIVAWCLLSTLNLIRSPSSTERSQDQD